MLDSLDIPTTRRTSNAPLRGRLITDLHRVAERVDGTPSTDDVESHSQFSYYDYRTEFGGIRDAREAADLD